MTPEELKQHVQKQLKKGYPGGELRAELLQQGYTAEAIEEAFKPDRTFSNADIAGKRLQIVAGMLVITGIGKLCWQPTWPGRPSDPLLGMAGILGGIILFFVARFMPDRRK